MEIIVIVVVLAEGSCIIIGVFKVIVSGGATLGLLVVVLVFVISLVT
jgi:hypothetical protein